MRVAWELAQALGVVALVAALLLCLVPLRPRERARSTLSLPAHTLIGWLALAAAVLHALLLPSVDRKVLEHVKPSAPLYEWAGILALVMYLALTLPATEFLRPRLWKRHRSFQALHVTLSCVALALIAAHVIGTGRYVHGPLATLAGVGVCAAALLALLRRRRRPSPAPAGHTPGLVYGRNSPLVRAVVVAAVAGVGALLLPGARPALRESPRPRQSPLELDFPHAKHRDVRCVTCHHDYLDHSGSGSCIACHRSGRSDLREGAETRFHGFCLDCHRDPPPPLTKHGPVTGCGVCHRPAGQEASGAR